MSTSHVILKKQVLITYMMKVYLAIQESVAFLIFSLFIVPFDAHVDTQTHVHTHAQVYTHTYSMHTYMHTYTHVIKCFG